MVINLPEKVKYIIDRITEAGYEAYAVGGMRPRQHSGQRAG